MVIVEIVTVVTIGLLIVMIGEFADRLGLGKHWTSVGCLFYFTAIVCVVPVLRFSTPEWTQHPRSMVHISDEAYGWSFFWLVAAGVFVWLLQGFKAPPEKRKRKPKRKRG